MNLASLELSRSERSGSLTDVSSIHASLVTDTAGAVHWLLPPFVLLGRKKKLTFCHYKKSFFHVQVNSFVTFIIFKLKYKAAC